MQLSQGFPWEVACLRASLINGDEGTFSLVSADIARSCSQQVHWSLQDRIRLKKKLSHQTLPFVTGFPGSLLPFSAAHQMFPLVLTCLLGSSNGPVLTICIPSCSSQFRGQHLGDPSRGWASRIGHAYQRGFSQLGTGNARDMQEGFSLTKGRDLGIIPWVCQGVPAFLAGVPAAPLPLSYFSPLF